nr:MAG TPA: hypothetical protein [Caudoviricetes sp.]
MSITLISYFHNITNNVFKPFKVIFNHSCNTFL